MINTGDKFPVFFIAVGFKSLQPLSLKDLKETPTPNFFYALSIT